MNSLDSYREYSSIYKVVIFGILKKSAITEVLLFCVNTPDKFLENKLVKKRVVSKKLHFSIHSKLAPTELYEIMN